jgi:hypothetical protein
MHSPIEAGGPLRGKVTLQVRQTRTEVSIETRLFKMPRVKRRFLKLPQEIQLQWAQPEVQISCKRTLSNEAQIVSRPMGNHFWNVQCKRTITSEFAKPVCLVLEKGVYGGSHTRLHEIDRLGVLLVEKKDCVLGPRSRGPGSATG